MFFTTDLHEPEGPVLLPDGSWLVVEMATDRGCVTQISADGRAKKTLARTGRPNGLAADKDGNIWVAESSTPSLLRLGTDGRVETWLTECDGSSFIFPNDLAFGPDGLLYMTDSGIYIENLVVNGKIRPDYHSLEYDGRVYQIDLKRRRIRRLDSGLLFTNGICFGPDEALYINETVTGNVYRYEWNGSEIGPRTLFGNVVDPAARLGWVGPDGMKFGADGRLYVTVYAQGDVTVLGGDGQVVERIKTAGKRPTNLAFGPAGEKRIYVTEVECGVLESLEVVSDGFPLHVGA